MIFSEDAHNGQTDTSNPTWDYIEDSLRKIDPVGKAYFILTDDSSSYVQCAGEKEKLTIEYRQLGNKIFAHYVLGNKKNSDSRDIIWTQINCKVGPIHIHQNEVLNIQDAILIFKTFYEKTELPSTYNKRNTTKQFEKNKR